MYNEKDWEKNHEPLNGENDVDITERLSDHVYFYSCSENALLM